MVAVEARETPRTSGETEAEREFVLDTGELWQIVFEL